jgi:hypothetical protein
MMQDRAQLYFSQFRSQCPVELPLQSASEAQIDCSTAEVHRIYLQYSGESNKKIGRGLHTPLHNIAKELMLLKSMKMVAI